VQDESGRGKGKETKRERGKSKAAPIELQTLFLEDASLTYTHKQRQKSGLWVAPPSLYWCFIYDI
jgi:hypothetical protein